MFNPLHPVLRRQSNKVEESWDSDDCGINMPTVNHLMQPFWFFSYRISANILTHTLSLSHLTVLGASHFSRTLSTISSLREVLCLLIFLATYRLCSPSASPTTPCVVALLGSLCLSASSWLWRQLCSALLCWQSVFNAEGIPFYIWAWSLSRLIFLDACSIFPFMSPVITSKSTCPKLSLSSSSPHPQDSISQNHLFVPR